MPGKGGFELQRRLAASRHDITVIFSTAHGDEDGAAPYLLKPFTEEALLNAIHAALRLEVVER